MKKNNSTVTVVSNLSTSATRTFTVSSKLVRNSLIAFSLLLLIFGFIISDYLAMSFDKEKIKEMQSRMIYLENVIDKLEKEKRNNIYLKKMI